LISRSRQKHVQNFRPDAAPLHHGQHIERAEVDRPVFDLLLNPTHILVVGGYDPDFVNFEEPSKVPLLARLIPAEKAFDHSTHRLEIEVAGEDGVFTARCSKRNLHYSLPPLGFCTFEKWQARPLSVIEIFRQLTFRTTAKSFALIDLPSS
jgi:hypothetical protein